MRRLQYLLVAIAASILLPGCGSAPEVGDGGGGHGGAPSSDGAADGGPDSGIGLALTVRAGSGESAMTLPIVSGTATIESAALWFSRLDVVSDQGSSARSGRSALGYDAARGLQATMPDAPPGLYSLVHVELAPADQGAPLPDGFAGQRLSARAAGHLASGRAFSISEADQSSVDLRAATPMDLAPGRLLRVTVQVDVSVWLRGVSLDEGGGDSNPDPLVIGPESHGDLVEAFRSAVEGSLALSLE